MKRKTDIFQIPYIESLKAVTFGILLCSACGWLFYKSAAGILLLFPLLIPLYKRYTGKYREKQRNRFSLEFRDGLSAFLASLEAGYSAENALEEACRDLSLIYDEKALIRKEFNRMVRQIRAGSSIENAFTELSLRTKDEEIRDFAEVFVIAKRTGGDIISIIRSSESIISEKIEVMKEIRTMLSGKQFETAIMQWIPLGILAYLNICNAAYLEPLYETIIGKAVMSILLFIYGVLVLWIEKIMDIEV